MKNQIQEPNSSQKIQGKSIVKVERVHRITKMVEEQKVQIEYNLKKQFQIFIKQLQNSNIEPDLLEQSYQCLSNFLKACFNMLSVYFPLLKDNSFVSLQSQKQIMERAYDVKNSIFRAFKSLCSKLSTNQKKFDKIKQKGTQKKNNETKGLNSKIPVHNTVVLTQWLLRNFNNPYPTNQQKQQLAKESGLTSSKVNNWFVNSRERVIKRYTRNEPKEIGTKQKKNLDSK